MLLPSKVAVPESEIAQASGTPGPPAVAVADQLTVVPVSVPRADPVILRTPTHVAENVPDPLLPENSVTDQVKFVHASWTEPDPTPGRDCVGGPRVHRAAATRHSTGWCGSTHA